FLPDTFRHQAGPRLKNKYIADSSRNFGALRPGAQALRETDTLYGTYFHLDTEYPGHYGHVTLEVIARLWGWQYAKEKYPSLKALVSSLDSEGNIPQFERAILNAFGI